MSERRVVITGIGVLSPLGSELELFWQNITAGKSGIGPVTRFDTTQYDCKFGGEVRDFNPEEWMPIKEARRTDRFVQYGVGAAKKAMVDSGIDMAKEDANRVGVLIGSGIGGMETIEDQVGTLIRKGPGRVSPFMIPMLIVNMASGYVSMLLGAKGPNLAVVSACATATHALGEAARAIVHNDADIMIAGGSEAAITQMGYAGFCAMKAMSTRNDAPERASRPFDAERDGFVMGEGSGMLVLETLENAQRRGANILAEVAGYGMSGDAYHITAPAEGGDGGYRVTMAAMKDAK